MSLRAAPEACKLESTKRYVCNKTFERPNSQDTWNMPCERMHATTGFPTVMKPSKTSVSQFYESGQGSPVTTWADILSYRPRSSSNEAANHKHEHQTCYLLVAASKVYTKVHDNKVGVLTCPRLMCNKKLQICAPWNIWKQDLRRQLKLQTVPLSFKNKTSKTN